MASSYLVENETYGTVADANDGEGDTSGVYPTGGFITAGIRSTDVEVTMWLRFPAVAAGQGSTVVAAFLDLSKGGVTGAPTWNVYGQAVDNASSNPASWAILNGYTKTTAVTSYTPDAALSHWVIDVTAIAQEIVNRAGWVSGNDMMILITNTHAAGSGFNHYATVGSVTRAVVTDRPVLGVNAPNTATSHYQLEDGSGNYQQEFDYGIAASADDGRNNAGVIVSNGGSVLLGINLSNVVQNGYFRFTSIAIAQGAMVTSAYLGLYVNAAGIQGAPTLAIYGQNVDNASSNPPDGATYDGYATTTAFGTSAPVATPFRYNIDVTAVVQEIVNRAGWVSGNAIMFLVKNTHAAVSATHNVDWITYDIAASFDWKRPYFNVDATAAAASPVKGRNVNREAVHRSFRW